MISAMGTPDTLAAIAATFLIAGTVKGVIGLGLPSISLALLTAAIGLQQAMVLIVIPSLVTNIWQAATGGHGRAILRRAWPFLLMATATVGIGVLALTRVDVRWLSGLLGLLLATYALLSLNGIRFTVSHRDEAWVGFLIGTVNGTLTGMTGSAVVPGVMFLQGMGLSRDALVQAMGILFTSTTLALGLALGGSGLLTLDLGLLSAAALVPAACGMVIGQRIRRAISETLFRRTFFLSLLALGLYLLARAIV